MALADFLGALRRRWYLLLVGLLVTGALGYGALTTNPPTYAARGLVLLLPSKLTLKTSPNPLLDLDGLELPGRVLVAYYASADAQAQIAKAAPSAQVAVSIDDSTGGPVIAVDVNGATADGTLKALNYVVDSIPPNLARIQAQVGAPADSAVRSTPLVIDRHAQTKHTAQIRTTLAAMVAGVVITAVVVFGVDGIAFRRKRRKLEALPATEDEDDSAHANHDDHDGDHVDIDDLTKIDAEESNLENVRAWPARRR